MNRNGVAGFNILDHNFSRDVSEMGMSELGISELGTTFVEKRMQRRLKKNVFKEVARGAMAMPMFRTVDGFYGYGTDTDPGSFPKVYVELQDAAKLKVTWDQPDVTPWKPGSTINHYYLVLRGSTGTSADIDLFIGRTENATREYTIDLGIKYYISGNGISVLNPPTNNIKDNTLYSIRIFVVVNDDVAHNSSMNNGQMPNVYPSKRISIGISYSFKLMKQSSGPPTNVTGVAGDTIATINWNAPTPSTATGQTSATTGENLFYVKNKGYMIEHFNDTGGYSDGYYVDGKWIKKTVNVFASSISTDAPTSQIITSLKNNNNYDFTVYSVSYIGNSLSAASDTVRVRPVPPATKPDPPNITSVVEGDTFATVNWTPGSDGGSPIMGYSIYAYGNPSLTGPFASYVTSVSPTATTARVPATTGVGLGPPLINGNIYYFNMKAFNYDTSGSRRFSEPSNMVSKLLPIPIVAPTPPASVSAVAGNESATVSWSSPSEGGTSAIIKYTVTAYRGNTADTGVDEVEVTGGDLYSATKRTATVIGLTNGIAYRFKVKVTNSQQLTSVPSVSSNEVTPVAPATAPSAPTGITADPGNASATVTWNAVPSGSIGAASITNYRVTPYIGTTAQTAVDAGTATSKIITGLINGTAYTFKVTATNSANLTSVPSVSSSSVTPVAPATAPSAPTGITADPGNASATVTWTAVPPGSIGAASITNYTVTAYTGTTVAKTVDAGTATTATVSPLTNGTAYTFKVTATNSANLPSVPSVSSSSVTPNIAPGSPTISGTALDSSVRITWTAPTANGGSPITGYSVMSGSGTILQDISGSDAIAAITTNSLISVTISSLTNETPYTFKVTARNSSFPGEPSNQITVTPTSVTGPPGLPTNLSANATTNKTVIFSWTPSDNRGGDTNANIRYTVKRCSDSACSAVLDISDNVTTSSYTTAVLPAGTYYFSVNARNSKNSSLFTASISVTIEATPANNQPPPANNQPPVTTPPNAGITSPLNVSIPSPYEGDPIISLIISTVILGAIFMALFSSYSPVNLRKFNM